MTLVEFLLARLAEDEAAAAELDGEQWWPSTHVGDHYNFGVVQDRAPDPNGWPSGQRVAMCGVEGLDNGEVRAAHIARHDPARVLAEVEAKRAIIDAFEHKAESMRLYPNPGNAGGLFALEGVLRLLALPYADHCDYQAEWA